jgi:Nucleotidyltransferase domain
MLAETCASLLGTTRPLHTIFGPHDQPDVVAEQRSRCSSPSLILPKVSGSPIGIRMERRRYFSDPRVREELMNLYDVRSCFFWRQAKGCMPDHVCSIQTISPGQSVRDKRRRTIAKVESSILSHFGQGYRVEAFGSTQYGVDGPNSDLDLVVIVGIPLMLHL